MLTGKVRGVAGLYISPPENALVLCVDEKSQIQALDRTAPILPMLPATPARMTHDYVRNGTTRLFAALDLASGSVIAQPCRRHRHQEFLRFLKLIDAAVPRDLDLHLVPDNYATHKTPAIHQWLLKHPRFHLHFTPPAPAGSTSSSAGPPSSPAASPAGQRTAASPNSKPASASGSTSGTRTPGPSSGPRPPTRSCRPSPPTVNELSGQDTRANQLHLNQLFHTSLPKTQTTVATTAPSDSSARAATLSFRRLCKLRARLKRQLW